MSFSQQALLSSPRLNHRSLISFAMAYSRLALSYHALGFDDKAEQTSRRAVTFSDNLPAQEKYLVEANHAVVTNDNPKGDAAYEKLTEGNPDDADAQLALADLYEQVSNYDEARKRLARVRAADSKNLDALLASGRVEVAREIRRRDLSS